MPRPASPLAVFNPALAWSQFALRYGEMLAASAVVIHHRSQRMAAAGPRPGARDQREFNRMVGEKLEAASESAQAMALRMAAANFQLYAELTQRTLAAGSTLLTLWMRPPLFWSVPFQARAVQGMLGAMLPGAARLSRMGAGIARATLAPVHSRATANARRLVYRPIARRARKAAGH